MSAKIPELRERIFSDVGNKTAIVMPGKMGIDEDDRLLELGGGIGQLAKMFDNGLARRDQLQRIAAYAIGWATMLGAKNVFDIVHRERDRQEKLFKAGEFNFTAASPTASAKRKFRILFEEGGEVAQEVDDLEYATIPAVKKAVTKRLIKELVQVAAVCVAWLESLEVKS